MKLIKNIFSVGLLIGVLNVNAQQIKISNIVPRKDDAGHVIDAHDGRVIRFGDTYYWYGTSYDTTNGFTKKNYYRCYSSSDMTHWKSCGTLIIDAPEGVYYRPHVVYNAKTKKYVLWYNWYPTLWNGQYGVAVSNSPTGPFKIINKNVNVLNLKRGVGDLNLYVDDNNNGFLIYNTIENHEVSVEKLSADYLSSTLISSGPISQNCEAVSMFKRNGKYYVLTDVCCCFCKEGSGAMVFISDNPLKEYRYSGNINKSPGKPLYLLSDGITDMQNFEMVNKEDTILLKLKKASRISSVQVDLILQNVRTHCSAKPIDGIIFANDLFPHFYIEQFLDGKWQPIKLLDSSFINKNMKAEILYKWKEFEADQIRIRMSVFHEASAKLSEIKCDGLQSVIKCNDKTKNNIIIPAQQTHVMEVMTNKGVGYIWMGDLWGSRPDNVKGHDFQYWSEPLEFESDGSIKPLRWSDEWTMELVK